MFAVSIDCVGARGDYMLSSLSQFKWLPARRAVRYLPVAALSCGLFLVPTMAMGQELGQIAVPTVVPVATAVVPAATAVVPQVVPSAVATVAVGGQVSQSATNVGATATAGVSVVTSSGVAATATVGVGAAVSSSGAPTV